MSGESTRHTTRCRRRGSDEPGPRYDSSANAGTGTELAGMADRNNPSFLLDQAQPGGPGGLPSGPTIIILPPLGRPEGNFGTANAFNPNASRRIFRLGGK